MCVWKRINKITHSSTLTGKTAVTDHHHRNALAHAHWTEWMVLAFLHLNK